MFNNKSTFGTPSFGSGTFGNTASPFGQGTSAFTANKPLGGTTFGTQPFGASQPSSSIFGSTQPSTGVFGSTAGTSFGQQSAGFGGFGTSNQTSVFNTTPQQPAGSGLFSNASSTAFGAQKSAFGGFGNASSSSLFGQPQATQQQSSGLLFNASATPASSGLFGGVATSGLGATSTGGSGTVIKFVPVNGTDTMMKNGASVNINTKHQCITVMKEYENKSLEELRFEDYTANRKGPSQGSTLSGFGATNQTSLFSTNTPAASTSTSLFGSNQNKSFFGSSNTGFGTSTGSGIFGQANQTASPFNKPAFGTPTTSANSSFSFGNTGTSAFGNTTQVQPLFGSSPMQSTGTTGLFGTTNTAQTNTGFGTSAFGSTGFGAQTQNQASPFGVKPLTFGTAAPASSTGFSFGATPTTSANSFMFNSKPTTTGFGNSTFGQTNTGGFGGFGTTTNANTSLFGQANKPQFNFGAGTTGFGTTLGSTNTSVFGSTANKPTGLNLNTGFGSTNTTGFGGISSGFNFSGNTGGISCDPNASAFNQTQSPAQLLSQQQLLSLSASPYGDSPLFRNLYQDPSKKEEMLKPTNPQAQKDLICVNHKVTPKSSVKLKPKLLTLNHGKPSLLSGDEDEENDPFNGSFTPKRSVKKLVLKSRPSVTNVNVSLNSPATEASTPTVTVADKNGVNNSFIPRMLPLNSSILNDSELGTSVAESPINLKSNTYVLRDSTRVQLNSSANENASGDITSLLKSTSDNEKSRNQNSSSDTDDSEVKNDVAPKSKPHPAGVILTRPGYYTIPSLDELATMVDDDGNCFVENFSIGREGYGNVFFPGITNVANLNLDELVHFRRKEVIIYVTDESKPPVGHGLNKKAQVTLDCVWPNDKTSRTPIKSPERLKYISYEDKLEKATVSMGARFKEYRPETGSWVFQVDHFSKYGLNDSDDEDIPAAQGTVPPSTADILQKQPPTQLQQLQKQATFQDARMSSLDQWNESSSEVLAQSAPLRLRGVQEDEEMETTQDQNFIRSNDSSDNLALPASHRLIEVVGADTHRVQAMKATLFWSETEDQDMDENDDPNRLDMGTPKLRIGFGTSEKSFSDFQTTLSKPKIARFAELASLTPKLSSSRSVADSLSKFNLLKGSGMKIDETPRLNVKKSRQSLVPMSESVVYKKQYLVDSSAFMERSFRVGWANKLIISNCGFSLSQLQPKSSTTRLFQPFVVDKDKVSSDEKHRAPIVRLESVLSLPTLTEMDGLSKAHILQLLDVQLTQTLIDVDDNGIPFTITNSGVNLLHEHATVADVQAEQTDYGHHDYSFFQHCKSVWNLTIALWGKLDEDDHIDESDNYSSHAARREALSKWLSVTCKKIVSKETDKHQSDKLGQLESIFSYLTALQVKEASEMAQGSKNYRLSLLVSQAGFSVDIRETIRQQLEHWKESKADSYINSTLLKIYVILAGVLVWKTSDKMINVCHELDWIRALALHLWYRSSPVSPIADVLKEYDEAYQGLNKFGSYAAAPKPCYANSTSKIVQENVSSNTTIFDTCYNLLKLYADRSHRLEVVLSTSTYTEDPLDYRLSWFLAQALKAIGYGHLSEFHAETLNENFASQLTNAGLWEWAVFVFLHHKDSYRRKSCIKNLLILCCNKESITKEKEEFLLQKLKIPQEWLFEAKSIRARRDGNIHAEAYYLAKAGQYHESHKLIIRSIAPDAIIQENYDYLKGLLKEMLTPEKSSRILDWSIGGQVYLDYIHLSQTVDRILKGELSAYELERLQPEVTSLCNRIGNLQCFSAKDRLCVSEMAKKTANILRAVLSLGSGLTTIPSRLTAPLICKLPLPEDYGAQEFNGLSHAYLLEMT
ncbi:hypothetical protein CHUAL_005398 [Chamberlinius hualienensis]